MKDIQENCLNRKLQNENKNVNNTINEKPKEENSVLEKKQLFQ